MYNKNKTGLRVVGDEPASHDQVINELRNLMNGFRSMLAMVADLGVEAVREDEDLRRDACEALAELQPEIAAALADHARRAAQWAEMSAAMNEFGRLGALVNELYRQLGGGAS